MENWREISDTINLYNSIEKISVHFRVKYLLSLECGSMGGGQLERSISICTVRTLLTLHHEASGVTNECIWRINCR